MSRTTSKEYVASPVQYKIKFKGDVGQWSYWDKELGEEVILDSLDFIVLDMLSSITGWDDESENNIYSNLFRTTKDEVSVKADGKEIFKGTYAEDKAKIKELGGKFTSNIFALAMINGDYTPVRIELVGSSIWNWSEFLNEHGRTNIYQYIVTATKGEQQKKGAVKFYTPVFTFVKADDDLCSQADEFTAQKLDPYINQ